MPKPLLVRRAVKAEWGVVQKIGSRGHFLYRPDFCTKNGVAPKVLPGMVPALARCYDTVVTCGGALPSERPAPAIAGRGLGRHVHSSPGPVCSAGCYAGYFFVVWCGCGWRTTANHHPPLRVGTAVTPDPLLCFAILCNFCTNFVIFVQRRFFVQRRSTRRMVAFWPRL